ncbi:Transcription factor PAR1, partial [Mucuna pruriens]
MEQQDNTIIPTFLRKPDQNSPVPSHKSLHVFRRSRRRWSKEPAVKEVAKNHAVKKEEEEEDDEDEEDEREEIEKKIHTLQRIVPGGESFGVDKLFDETAGYILALQYQVKALRALTGFFDKLDKEKTKFGVRRKEMASMKRHNKYEIKPIKPALSNVTTTCTPNTLSTVLEIQGHTLAIQFQHAFAETHLHSPIAKFLEQSQSQSQ